mmetsp:Transcript_9365/g.12423  ORF Transcript_9365/g.12423 Transcript_9365/m.12423 type:complete len:162 (+) Transcript_9365:99-584(+)
MVSGIAGPRLSKERKAWRKDHPIGFYARPASQGDGSSDMFRWECGIPGKKGTDWEGGIYKVELKFSEEYPSKPPECKFTPPIFHPNVFKSGHICLSILKEETGWRSSISIKEVLVGIQDLLTLPNEHDPAQLPATNMYLTSKAKYSKKIRDQARQFAISYD